MFGAQGVLFAMKGQSDAYLVSTVHGTSPIPLSRLQFPDLNNADFTLQLFYIEAQTGEQVSGYYFM
jgi:hypothetical protein